MMRTFGKCRISPIFLSSEKKKKKKEGKGMKKKKRTGGFRAVERKGVY